MDDALEQRIEALERTVSDGEFDHDSSDYAEMETRLSAVESQLDDIDTQIEDLEAATQALRGYVGNIRAVNDDVEQRANTALAKAESLEATLDEVDRSAIDRPTATDGSRPPNAGSVAEANGDRVTTTETRETERCQACGRVHDGERQRERKSGPTGRPGATDGGSSNPVRDAGESKPSDDSLVPDDAAETGTLQRIRKLL